MCVCVCVYVCVCIYIYVCIYICRHVHVNVHVHVHVQSVTNTSICQSCTPSRDPIAKKKAESARVLRLQQLRRTLTDKYSENTFCTMENLDEAVVNKVGNIPL